mmetsp:Transcript_35726/g.59612  ORF Transcript_35726/g.59612 Transcript_35726/m.59612 type:complete len:84 (-) Transcript_35726:125-376(-)
MCKELAEVPAPDKVVSTSTKKAEESWMVHGYRVVPVMDKANNDDVLSVCASPTVDVLAVGRADPAGQNVVRLRQDTSWMKMFR